MRFDAWTETEAGRWSRQSSAGDVIVTVARDGTARWIVVLPSIQCTGRLESMGDSPKDCDRNALNAQRIVDGIIGADTPRTHTPIARVS